jgi:predicted Zn-dependent protease
MVGAAGAAAGAGGLAATVQLAAQLATLGSLYAFSRDNEREADALGFEMMAGAGYDPRQAPTIWERLLQEREAAKASTPFFFFATHPPTEERLATLRELADKAAGDGRATAVGREEFLARTLRFRATLLHDELRRREFASTQVLLAQLGEGGVRPGELHFFQGELHRLRAEADDEPKAIAAYREALAFPDAPPETHRSLGVLLLRAGDRPRARESFERYLERRPDAEDREMIRDQLRRLE